MATDQHKPILSNFPVAGSLLPFNSACRQTWSSPCYITSPNPWTCDTLLLRPQAAKDLGNSTGQCSEGMSERKRALTPPQ
eukprot:793138-Amphidinium_carterae.1